MMITKIIEVTPQGLDVLQGDWREWALIRLSSTRQALLQEYDDPRFYRTINITFESPRGPWIGEEMMEYRTRQLVYFVSMHDSMIDGIVILRERPTAMSRAVVKWISEQSRAFYTVTSLGMDKGLYKLLSQGYEFMISVA